LDKIPEKGLDVLAIQIYRISGFIQNTQRETVGPVKTPAMAALVRVFPVARLQLFQSTNKLTAGGHSRRFQFPVGQQRGSDHFAHNQRQLFLTVSAFGRALRILYALLQSELIFTRLGSPSAKLGGFGVMGCGLLFESFGVFEKAVGFVLGAFPG